MTIILSLMTPPFSSEDPLLPLLHGNGDRGFVQNRAGIGGCVSKCALKMREAEREEQKRKGWKLEDAVCMLKGFCWMLCGALMPLRKVGREDLIAVSFTQRTPPWLAVRNVLASPSH